MWAQARVTSLVVLALWWEREAGLLEWSTYQVPINVRVQRCLNPSAAILYPVTNLMWSFNSPMDLFGLAYSAVRVVQQQVESATGPFSRQMMLLLLQASMQLIVMF